MRAKNWAASRSSSGALPAITCSMAMANSSGLNERPSPTSLQGVATLYQGSILYAPTVEAVIALEGVGFEYGFLR